MTGQPHWDGRRAEKYDAALFSPRSHALQRRFGKLHSLLPRDRVFADGARILEIGCGTGLYSRQILEAAKVKLVSTDLSFDMVRRAQEAGVAPWLLQCGAENLPFQDASFDYAVAIACFHHMADTPAAFAAIAGVLKPDGALLLMEPNPLCPLNVLLGTARRIERGMLRAWPSRWAREAAAAGLRLERCATGSFFPGWPEGAAALYASGERFLGRLPLVRRLGIFNCLLFIKDKDRA